MYVQNAKFSECSFVFGLFFVLINLSPATIDLFDTNNMVYFFF